MDTKRLGGEENSSSAVADRQSARWQRQGSSRPKLDPGTLRLGFRRLGQHRRHRSTPNADVISSGYQLQAPRQR